jgi:hypothetical protein
MYFLMPFSSSAASFEVFRVYVCSLFPSHLAVVVGLGITRMITNRQDGDVWRFGTLMIVSSIFVAYFAIDGVRHDSRSRSSHQLI